MSTSTEEKDVTTDAALAREPGARSWVRVSRRLTIVLAGIACVLVAVGYALAVGGAVALGIDLIAIAALLFLYRELEGGRLVLDSEMKAYRGERMVADLLRMIEPLGFRVVHGLEFVDAHGRTRNIDHAVVGPTGVFAVETKNWNGRMWKTGDDLIHNGFNERAAVLQALAEAKELKRRLKARRVPVRWVEAVLVSAKSTLPDVRLEFKYVTVIGASDLVPYIRDRKRILSTKQVAAVVDALIAPDAPGSVTPPPDAHRRAA